MPVETAARAVTPARDRVRARFCNADPLLGGQDAPERLWTGGTPSGPALDAVVLSGIRRGA
ncbi:hypothetical protein GCM10010439_13410 [Actinocorallia aurantiaca]|uniref:Uncharacterized protein n=1 Tax=Actinocorallia aurantiaca TaxID=46204 RepID=A0ABN3U086_9ACTN